MPEVVEHAAADEAARAGRARHGADLRRPDERHRLRHRRAARRSRGRGRRPARRWSGPATSSCSTCAAGGSTSTSRPRSWPAGRRPRPRSPASPRPTRGWERLYVDHVMQADTGADLDFLVGATGIGDHEDGDSRLRLALPAVIDCECRRNLEHRSVRDGAGRALHTTTISDQLMQGSATRALSTASPSSRTTWLVAPRWDSESSSGTARRSRSAPPRDRGEIWRTRRPCRRAALQSPRHRHRRRTSWPDEDQSGQQKKRRQRSAVRALATASRAVPVRRRYSAGQQHSCRDTGSQKEIQPNVPDQVTADSAPAS